MPRKTTKRLKEKAQSEQSHLVLMSVASFLESTIIPIPLETVLIPYYHYHRACIWRTALVVTLACLLGASVFYWLGTLAMDSWGQTVVETFSDEQSFEALKETLGEKGFFLILLAGITPIPFQIAMLAAGAADYSFALFLVAATLARGVRYFGLAWLVLHYGDDGERVWKENKLKFSLIAVLVLAVIYGLGRGIQTLVMG